MQPKTAYEFIKNGGGSVQTFVINYQGVRPSRLRLAATGFLCAGMIVSGVSVAAETETGTPEITHTVKVKNTKKMARAKKNVPEGQLSKDAPAIAAAPPVQACNSLSAYAINEKLGFKGWAFVPPSMGDSVLLDYGCWRTNLAKYGIGLIGQVNGGPLTTNLLNHYTPPSNQQQYVGQRPTASISTGYILTYDLSRWGIPDGQFQIEGGTQNTTYAPNYASNTLLMEEMKIYGTVFDKKLEYEAGYISNFLRFQGTFIGGNIANPFGPAAGSAAEVGQSFPPEPAPSFNLKWNITDHWYDRFAIQRSMPGSVNVGGLPNLTALGPAAFGNMFAVEHYTNPTGFKFTNSSPCVFGVCYHSPRQLFINEIGYQTHLGESGLFTWVRLTGYYNTTTYFDYSTGGTTKNYAVSLYGDQQIWQAEPGSPFTGYKGLYIGGAVAYDDPKANALSQDYEARIYTLGLFNRPKDQLALTYQHQVVSHYITNSLATKGACAAFGICTRHAINSYAVSYTANIMSGIYFTLGAQYIDHPAVAFAPGLLGNGSNQATIPVAPGLSVPNPLSPLNINHAVNLLASLYMNF
jgi:porin